MSRCYFAVYPSLDRRPPLGQHPCNFSSFSSSSIRGERRAKSQWAAGGLTKEGEKRKKVQGCQIAQVNELTICVVGWSSIWLMKKLSEENPRHLSFFSSFFLKKNHVFWQLWRQKRKFPRLFSSPHCHSITLVVVVAVAVVVVVVVVAPDGDSSSSSSSNSDMQMQKPRPSKRLEKCPVVMRWAPSWCLPIFRLGSHSSFKEPCCSHRNFFFVCQHLCLTEVLVLLLLVPDGSFILTSVTKWYFLNHLCGILMTCSITLKLNLLSS